MLDKQDVRYAVFYTADHTSSPTPKDIAFDFDFVRSAQNSPLGLEKNDTKNICFPIWSEHCQSPNTTCACLLFCMAPNVTYVQKSDNRTYTATASGSDAFTMMNG